MKKTLKDMARKVVDTVTGHSASGGIYAELERDHAAVIELIDSLLEDQRDVARRRRIYPEIRNSLLAHALAEQRQLYMVLREHDETREMAEQHMQDHDEIECRLSELDRYGRSEDRWLASFRELEKLVTSHIEIEEGELFVRARQVIDDETSVKIARLFRDEKTEIKRRLESGNLPATTAPDAR
jgi:hemerythrin superfamily protein